MNPKIVRLAMKLRTAHEAFDAAAGRSLEERRDTSYFAIAVGRDLVDALIAEIADETLEALRKAG